MKNLQTLIVIISLTTAPLTYSEEVDKEIQVTAKDLSGYLDLSVPETPAFTTLGVTPENVVNPASQHELALAILDGVDQNGNAQSGIAIEASPFALAKGDLITIKKYKSEYLTRFLYNTKVSYATVSGSSESDKADRKAIGLRFSIFNNGDLRLNQKVSDCFTTIPKPEDGDVLEIVSETESDGKVTVLKQVKTSSSVLEAAGKCTKEASKSLWNAMSWDAGLSYYEAEDKAIDADGYAIWSSFSLPIGRDGQAIFHAKYFEDMLSVDVNDDKVMDLKDGEVYAARFKWGSNKVNFMVEASHSDVEYPTIGLEDKYEDYLIGTEFQAYQGIWFQVAFGKRNGSSIKGNDDNYLSGQIRWAISESSLLK